MLKSLIEKCLLVCKELVAPPFCFYCKRYGYTRWCAECVALIKPILATKVVFDRTYAGYVHAVSAYEDPLKSLIIAKKWSDYTASTYLGQLVWQHSALQRIPFDYIVPIPLHWSRYAYRGYNQAYGMAQEISRLSGKPVSTCLSRVKRTSSQAGTPFYKRYSNVQEAFFYDSRIDLQGKVLMLVDDVMTTGSTLQAAGKALCAARPAALHAVVACRVVEKL